MTVTINRPKHFLVLGIFFYCIVFFGVGLCYAQQGDIVAPPAISGANEGIRAIVPVGHTPGGVAVNYKTNRAFVVSYDDGTVSVIDGNTRTVISTIKVGGNLCCVAVNSLTNRIYVGNCFSHAINVIDGNSNSIIATISMGNDDPSRLAVNSVTNRVYIICDGKYPVHVLDCDTNTIKTIQTNINANEIAINPITNRLYISDNHNICVVDGKTNGMLYLVSVGNNDLGAIAVNPLTNLIYVADRTNSPVNDRDNEMLYIIDGRTNIITHSVKISDSSPGIAIDQVSNQVYIALDTKKSVDILDGNTNLISAITPIAITPGTSGDIMANYSTHQIYIVNMDTNTINIIDGTAYLTTTERDYSTKLGMTYDVMFPPFTENFPIGKLDHSRWAIVKNSKGSGQTMDIVGTNVTDQRLRLRLDHKPNADYTFHGLCTQQPVINFNTSYPTEIDADIDWTQVDWRKDEDPCGDMTAGILISPDYDLDNPHHGTNYLQVMYQGTIINPSTAHLEVSAHILNLFTDQGHRGGHFNLYDENYKANTTADNPLADIGRKIGLQHLRIIVSDKEIAVWENGIKICDKYFENLDGLKSLLPWSIGYLYILQGGSTGRACDVYIGNISVHQLTDQPATK